MTELSLIHLSAQQRPFDLPQTLQHLQTLSVLGQNNGDTPILVLSKVMRLHHLVEQGRWVENPPILDEIGCLLNIACLQLSFWESSPDKAPEIPAAIPREPFEAAMLVHAIILACIHHTQVGQAREAAVALAYLHQELDNGILELFPQGFVMVRSSC